VEVASFSALHRYIVLTCLYLIGGWAYQDIGPTMILEAHQKLASLINADLTIDRESIIQILCAQSDLDENVIADMLPIVEKKRLPNPLTALTRHALNEEEFARARLELIALGLVSEVEEVDGTEIQLVGGRVMTLEEYLVKNDDNRETIASQTHATLGDWLPELDDKKAKFNVPTLKPAEVGEQKFAKPRPSREPIPMFLPEATYELIKESLDAISDDKQYPPGLLPSARPPTGPATFNFSASYWAHRTSSRLKSIKVVEVLHVIQKEPYMFVNPDETIITVEGDEVTKTLGEAVHGRPQKQAAPKKEKRAWQSGDTYLERAVKNPVRIKGLTSDEQKRYNRTMRIHAARGAKEGGHG